MKNKVNYCLLSLSFLFFPVALHAFDNIRNIPERNPYFTGREIYLNDMHKILQKYGKVYLTGYGGIGKTQLAKEYSYIHEKEYDLIWWFDLKNNLVIQYENLLAHLSNDKRFTDLLHIKAKDISPNVIIDFTNSLLSRYRCKWLLIFDNVSNNKGIKLPITRTFGHNIIITTREKPGFGSNVLTVGLFTNKESERYLFKIHPKEKQTEIIKLRNILRDYPLALAQVSEEILMYQNGIAPYLTKPHPKPMDMRSDITQEYGHNYHEVLEHTLMDIEQEDKKAAMVLVMLALLKTDIPKKFLKEVFGDKIEDKIITLSKYGVIEIVTQENSQLLCIHDVIRDMAIERFNRKNAAYKKEIILVLSKHLSTFYSEKKFQYLNKLDVINVQIAPLYTFIDVALQNNVVDEEIINLVIIALTLNQSLFNRYANYELYQQLANKVYSINLNNITATKKALLYSNLIYLDLILETEESFSSFEKEIIRLSHLLENNNNYEELFCVYTYLTQLYLFVGDLEESKKYAEKAKNIISYAKNCLAQLRYWYVVACLSYDLTDIDAGIAALHNYEKLNNRLSTNTVGKLLAKSLEIEFTVMLGQKEVVKKELEDTIKYAAVYYNGMPSSFIGNLKLIKALIYFRHSQYELAKKQCVLALNTIDEELGKNMISLYQAHVHFTLGEIYEKQGYYNHALKKYTEVLKFYNRRSCGKVISMYEYGKLLANLSTICYKTKNFIESKSYFQKLITNFGLEHELVKKLIKNFSVEYMYQIGNFKLS